MLKWLFAVLLVISFLRDTRQESEGETTNSLANIEKYNENIADTLVLKTRQSKKKNKKNKKKKKKGNNVKQAKRRKKQKKKGQHSIFYVKVLCYIFKCFCQILYFSLFLTLFLIDNLQSKFIF